MAPNYLLTQKVKAWLQCAEVVLIIAAETSHILLSAIEHGPNRLHGTCRQLSRLRQLEIVQEEHSLVTSGSQLHDIFGSKLFHPLPQHGTRFPTTTTRRICCLAAIKAPPPASVRVQYHCLLLDGAMIFHYTLLLHSLL